MAKLTRRTDNKVIAGVCSGIAEHFHWDVNLVRLVTVVLTIVTTGWVVPILYFVAWTLLPEEGTGKMGFDTMKAAYDDKVKPTVDEKVKPFYEENIKANVDKAFNKPSGEPGPAPQAPTHEATDPAEWEKPYNPTEATGGEDDASKF